MRHTVLLALVTALIVTTGGSASAASSTQRESDVIKYTNAERAKRDLKKLSTSSCLARYAEAHAKRQAKAKKVYRQKKLSTVRTACRLSTVAVRVTSSRTSGRSVVKS